MSKKTAIDKYLGQNNHKRLNCAQTILSTFQNKFNINDETIDLFSQFGAGKAPNGLCGAYYSVLHVLKNNLNDEDSIKNFETNFCEKYKSGKCRDLKSNKISCLDAIGECADFLDTYEKK
jgi:hypothetical protein